MTTTPYSEETGKAKELLKTVPQNERRVNEQQNQLDELIKEEKTLSTRLVDNKTKFSEAKSALNAASTRFAYCFSERSTLLLSGLHIDFRSRNLGCNLLNTRIIRLLFTHEIFT